MVTKVNSRISLRVPDKKGNILSLPSHARRNPSPTSLSLYPIRPRPDRHPPPPPRLPSQWLASSSSHLRRSSRNAADRKQGALPADGKQSSLRVAAATVKSTNLGANAVAASDGKQTAMGVSATTNLDSAPAAGRTEENLQYALYPIDSGTDAAPAAERTEEAEFLQKFYCSLNFNLLGLHRFYSTGAELLWNFSGRRVHLKTAKEIKSYMYGAVSKRKFHASHFDSLSVSEKNSVFLTVHRSTKSVDNQSGTFVHSILLDLPGRLILNDSLTVTECVSKRKFHASHFDSLSVSEKNSVFLTVHRSTKSVDNQSGTFVHSILLDLPGRLILNDSLTVTECAAKVGSLSKLQDNDSKDQCGLCKEIYDSTDPREWVCCDWCDMWIHVECDPTCIRDMKTLKSSKYHCPKCKPKHKDVLTVNGSLKGKSVEPIIVSCFGMDAIYKAEERMIKCLCRSCSINPMMMSLNKWEKHTKCVTRNWKKSIKLKGTETLLAKFIEDHIDEIGRSSVSTELHQASSAEASQHPAVEASQLPAAASSLSYAMSKIKHSQKTNVCILYDYDRMKSHQDKDNDHEYEIAARIFETWNTLKEDGVMDRIAREAFDSADPDIVLGVHDHKLLKDVDGLPKEDKKHDVRFSLFSSKGTREAIYSASGAAIRGVDLVLEGYYKQAFALIRPPGHQAGRSTAEGFCFFNNIAISANHAINHHYTEKVFVVNIDVHHGNGTQEIFYGNNKVLFVSTHGDHLGYPQSKKDESAIGEGKGEGYNVNIPLEIGFNDADICYAFDEVVLPVANEFKPDIVLVSAGYDAGVEEKIGECNVTAKGFGTLVHKLLSLAHGRMVLALEGGYNVTRLPICVSHTIRALLGDEDAFLQDHAYGDEPMHDSTISTVNRLKENLRLHWDVFKNGSAGPS